MNFRKRSKYMKFPKNNTKHVLKELGSTLQLSNIQQRLQNLLKPMMFIYKVNCPSTKDFPLHYWIPTFPISLSWGYFFDPNTNSFTEFSTDCIAFLICHWKLVSSHTPKEYHLYHSIRMRQPSYTKIQEESISFQQ